MPAKTVDLPPNLRVEGYYKGRGVFVDEAIANPYDFLEVLHLGLQAIEITGEGGTSVGLHVSNLSARFNAVTSTLLSDFRRAHKKGGKLIFIGNGGSASISSHMAIDYTKNAGIRAIAFNDVPTLTCLANDYGYEHIFSKQLKAYANRSDIVIIISSSGKSPNILEAAYAARELGCQIITLSGMNPDNKLRKMGNVNFYIPSRHYGQVEICHLSILHSMVGS